MNNSKKTIVSFAIVIVFIIGIIYISSSKSTKDNLTTNDQFTTEQKGVAQEESVADVGNLGNLDLDIVKLGNAGDSVSYDSLRSAYDSGESIICTIDGGEASASGIKSYTYHFKDGDIRLEGGFEINSLSMEEGKVITSETMHAWTNMSPEVAQITDQSLIDISREAVFAFDALLEADPGLTLKCTEENFPDSTFSI